MRDEIDEAGLYHSTPDQIHDLLDLVDDAPIHISRPSRRDGNGRPERIVMLPSYVYYLLICGAADHFAPEVPMEIVEAEDVLRNLALIYPSAPPTH